MRPNELFFLTYGGPDAADVQVRSLRSPAGAPSEDAERRST